MLAIRIVTFVLLINASLPKEAYGLLWYSPPIEFTEIFEGEYQDLSVDPFGDAFSAYVDADSEVRVSRFSDYDSAYEAPVLLAVGGGYFYSNIAVATGITGTAVCVWQRSFGDSSLESAYYNGSIWTVLPSSIYSDYVASLPLEPDLQMNSSGNALLSWSNPEPFSPFLGSVYVSFFNGGTQTWTAPLIIGGGASAGFKPKVAFNAAGDAFVIWRQNSGEIQSSYYNSSLLFWNGPISIATNATENYNVGIDAAGNAIAVWQNSSDSLVYSNYYNKTFDLFFPQVLTNVAGGPPSMGMTADGNAFVAWTNGSTGFYNEYRISIPGWTGVNTMPITTGSELNASIDSTGNALIAYLDSGDFNTMSIYKPFNSSFLAPSLAVANPNQIKQLITGLADNGRGFINGFNNSDAISGTFTITDISGRACTDTSGRRVRFLSWAPFRDPDIVAYYLKRNSTLIAVNLATQPRVYVDKDRNADITDVYTVIAVDSSGNELSRRKIALR